MSDAPTLSTTADAIKIGIVSISDRASTGVYEDKGLPALQQWLSRALINPLQFEPDVGKASAACISNACCEWNTHPG